MRKRLFLMIALCGALAAQAAEQPFGRGRLNVRKLAENAVRIQYREGNAQQEPLPEWIYVKDEEVETRGINVRLDKRKGTLIVQNRKGEAVFTATGHQLEGGEGQLTFVSPQDEYLFGLGQFQDGYSNLRGLSRRLTQVNTQISVPMLISSKGYGILWNNYGLTEFNPCRQSVRLSPLTLHPSPLTSEVVNVTSTEGGRREVRQRNLFGATIDVTEEGDYALLLDVGQKMARRHNLTIDGAVVIEMQNLWLPPTASAIVHLTAGQHQLEAELTKDDQPVVFFDKIRDETVFRSPVADAVDYTVFIGTPDDIYAQALGIRPAGHRRCLSGPWATSTAASASTRPTRFCRRPSASATSSCPSA